MLVPHTYGKKGSIDSDPEACKLVMDDLENNYKKNVHIVASEYNQSEIKYIIGLCDFFIGSRMHSCIAALSQAIPTVGIAYSKKFSGVFDSIGSINTVVDARFLEKEKIIKEILKKFSNRQLFAINTAQGMIGIRENINNVFTDMLNE